MEQLKISAIIPTKNRPNDLIDAIDSVLLQTLTPIELIIVDQSQEPSSYLFSGKFCHSPINLRYVHRPDITSLVQAKQFGVSVSNGAFVSFLEDDIVLDCNFFQKLADGFKQKTEMIGCCGRITNQPNSSKLYTFLHTLFFQGILYDPRVKIFNSNEKVDLVESHMISGGLSMWKSSVFDLEHFDTKNGFFMMEDVEFSTRLAKRVPNGLFVNCQAMAIHKVSPVNRLEYDLRQAQKMREAVIFYKKRRRWKGAMLGISLAMVWWTLGAVMECFERRTLSPLRGHVLGVARGLMSKVT